MNRKLLLAFVAVFGLGISIFALTHFLPTSEPGEAPTRDRLENRLERPSVRFHIALRNRLASEGERFAERVAGSQPLAAVADQLLGQEDVRDDVSATVLPAFGGVSGDPMQERLFILLSMISAGVKSDGRLPEYVVLYEAQQLEVGALEEALRGLALAARAFAFSRGGYCDLIYEDRAATAELPEVELAPLRTFQDADPEARAALGQVLEGVQRLLLDGALACCRMHDPESSDAAATYLEASIADLEQLDVAYYRLPILRAWARVLRGDTEGARAQLERVERERLGPEDRDRLRVVADAVAAGSATEALHRTLDQSWLSSMILEAAVEALAVRAPESVWANHSELRAAARFVQVEARLMKVASERHPLFDHTAAAR